MTEQTFGGLAVADPRSAAPAANAPEDTGQNDRRKLAVVGAVVAVLVVLIAAFFLMKGKGNSTAPAAVPSALAHAGTTATAKTPAASKPKVVKLPKSFAGVIGRDPFKALYVAPKSTGAGSGSGSTGTTTTSTTGTAVPPSTTTPGTSTPGTTTTGTTTPGTTTGGASTPVFRPIWIRLVKLTASGATFDVGFSDHKNLKVRRFSLNAPTPSKPVVFARNFAFLRMAAGSAVLQYGDGTPFVLDVQHNLMIVN
jgi:hypothetical protein